MFEQKTASNVQQPQNKYKQHSFQHRRATQALVANVILNNTINDVYDGRGNTLNLDDLITGETKGIWIKATCNKLGRLAQGYGDTKGTNTIEFIYHHEVPMDKG